MPLQVNGRHLTARTLWPRRLRARVPAPPCDRRSDAGRCGRADAGGCQRVGTRRPGCVDLRRRHSRKLGAPSANIVAGGIERLGLLDRIEDAEIGRGIGAGAGDPLPARGVRGEIRIDEGIPEPRLASLPRLEQVLDQERRRDHADTIVHPPRGPEFPHACVDDGIAGLAALPALEMVAVRPPWKAGEGFAERRVGERRVVCEEVIGELAPQQLLEERVGAAR